MGQLAGRGFDLDRGIADQLADLVGRLGAALSQLAHLAGDDRKALARCTRARRLHRRVQRQHAGLECHVVDHRDRIGDPARGVLHLLHRGHGFGHRTMALLGLPEQAFGQAVELARGLGVARHRQAELADRIHRRAQAAGLGVGAGGQALAAVGHL